jgi:Protein of unknown function (DUF2938)
MSESLEFILRASLIGIGATLVMDVSAALQKRLFGIPSTNYAMVGRWIGHMQQGRMTHEDIAQAAPVHGEQLIGWATHYAVGIIYAAALLAIWGMEWAYTPTLLPALIVGIVTVAAPFFVLQPAMGAGIAASKTPNPSVSRFRSIVAHTTFGIGLYIAAMVSRS